jgi:hypothetical protein
MDAESGVVEANVEINESVASWEAVRVGCDALRPASSNGSAVHENERDCSSYPGSRGTGWLAQTCQPRSAEFSLDATPTRTSPSAPGTLSGNSDLRFERCKLHAFVAMPNQVHLLATQLLLLQIG